MVSLARRNAFAEADSIPSDLVFSGSDDRQPELTIAIPTFQRPHLIRESVASALAQQGTRAIELIVVDNDPASRNVASLLAAFPQLAQANFRYYVNHANIGLYQNWNRCIQLGRGHWHSLLNDDDLLDPDFAETMLTILARNPGIDGLQCRKRIFDQREGDGAIPPSTADGAARRAAKQAYLEARFHGARTRHLHPRKFFFGALTGNTVGMVARKADLIALGGYYPDEYPSADHMMTARFAIAYRLDETRDMLASIRIAVNESARPEVIRGFIRCNQELREAMVAAGVVPRWWLRLSGITIARHRAILARLFDRQVPDTEVEAMLGRPSQPDRKRVFYALCAALGGL